MRGTLRWLFVSIGLVTACRPNAVPTPGAAQADASAAPAPVVASATPALSASASPVEAGVATSAPDAGPLRRRPLLVAALDRRRAAILLHDEAPPSGARAAPATPALLERSPIATAGVELKPDALSDDARASLAKVYRLGAFGAPRGECTGRLERVVDLARIVADDPTMGEEKLGDAELAARAFAQGSHSTAAIVELAPSCADVRWAVREGAPLPAAFATSRLDPRASGRVEATLAATSDAYKNLPNEKGWTRRFVATKVAPDRAWVLALRAQPGTPLMVCALVALDPDAGPKILGERGTCPETVSGATTDPEGTVVWFEHAMARLEDGALTVTYFPTTATAPYGAP